MTATKNLKKRKRYKTGREGGKRPGNGCDPGYRTWMQQQAAMNGQLRPETIL